jgi:hypothetical protein
MMKMEGRKRRRMEVEEAEAKAEEERMRKAVEVNGLGSPSRLSTRIPTGTSRFMGPEKRLNNNPKKKEEEEAEEEDFIIRLDQHQHKDNHQFKW